MGARCGENVAHHGGDHGAAVQVDQRGKRRSGQQAVDGRKLGEWIHDFTRTGQKRGGLFYWLHPRFARRKSTQRELLEETEMTKQNPAPPSSWQKILGIELSPVSHRERLVSALGGLVGMLAVYFSQPCSAAAGDAAAGAFDGPPRCMVFAVPHGCALAALAAARRPSGVGPDRHRLPALWCPTRCWRQRLATGLAIGAMHYLRCIHPPGGATALAAALGNESVQAMGFGFVAGAADAQRGDHAGGSGRLQCLFPLAPLPGFLVARRQRRHADTAAVRLRGDFA
jgi:hypothetical protein